MSSSLPSNGSVKPATAPLPMPKWLNFATAGAGGLIAWAAIHPFNTLGIRMNLAGASGAAVPKSFFSFAKQNVATNGVLSLYNGLSAGLLRQLFYATSRFGLFEVFRDELARHRETDIVSRLLCGCTSGGIAALISCPAEVTLVRMSNDASLPVEKRRGYSGVANAFSRILREEGVSAFFRGSGPFVNRAILVGAVQVGTYDQFRQSLRGAGIVDDVPNVLCASMASGLVYSVVTMPFETAKNRMAFQTPDPATGRMLYTGAIQTMRTIASREGVLGLWAGFPPYYLRCGGHTVIMFASVEWLRKLYNSRRVTV